MLRPNRNVIRHYFFVSGYNIVFVVCVIQRGYATHLSVKRRLYISENSKLRIYFLFKITLLVLHD